MLSERRRGGLPLDGGQAELDGVVHRLVLPRERVVDLDEHAPCREVGVLHRLVDLVDGRGGEVSGYELGDRLVPVLRGDVLGAVLLRRLLDSEEVLQVLQARSGCMRRRGPSRRPSP